MAEVVITLVTDNKGAVSAIKSVSGGLDELAKTAERAASSVNRSASAAGSSGGFNQLHSQLALLKGSFGDIVSGNPAAAFNTVGTAAGGMGLAVAGVVGVVAAAGAITAKWSAELVATGARLTDISARTDLSTDAIQKFEYGAKLTGTTLESVIGAAQKMELNLVSGAKGASEALNQLGLSQDRLMEMSLEEKVLTIGQALRGIEDPAKRAQLAFELMGRAGRQTLGFFSQDLRAMGEELENVGGVIDSDTIAAADRLDDAMTRLTTRWQAFKANAIGPVVAALADFLEKAHEANMFADKFDRKIGPSGELTLTPKKGVELTEEEKLSARFKELEFAGGDIGKIGRERGQILQQLQALKTEKELTAARAEAQKEAGIKPAISGPAPFKIPTVGTEMLSKATKELEKDVTKVAQELERAKAATDRFRDAFTLSGANKQVRELSKELKNVGGVSALSNTGLVKLVTEIEELRRAGATIPPELRQVEAALGAMIVALRAGVTAWMALQDAGVTSASAMADITKRSLDEVQKSTDEFARAFSQNIELPDVVPGGLNAFEQYRAEQATQIQEQKEFEKQRRAAMSSSARFTEDFNTGLGAAESIAFSLADAFEQMGGSAESGFGKVIAEITRTIGFMQQAAQAGSTMREGFDQGGFAGAMKVGQGAIQAAGAIGGATAQGSTGARTAKGALAGASAGAQFGPIGAAIGAGVGAVVGFIRGRKMQKDMDRVQNALGERFSEAFINSARVVRDRIKKEGFDVGIGEASKLMLAEAFQDVGGVRKFGMTKAADDIIKLSEAVKLGKLPFEEGTAAMGKAFSVLAEESLRNSDVIGTSVLRVIQRARELGQDVPEIKEFVKAALLSAGEGLGVAFKGIQIISPADAQSQATIFASTFWAAVKEVGMLKAVEAFKPAFDAMKASIEKAGFAPDLGGVEAIFDLAGKADFLPLLQGVEGLSQAMAGLANSGYLTQASFASFGQQAQSAFDQLKAQGLDSGLALQALQPLLQNIITSAESYGFTLDDNTRALIDQAKAAGIGFKTDPMDRMVSVLELIAQKLGATAAELGALGGAGSAAGDQIYGGMTTSADGIEMVGARASMTSDLFDVMGKHGVASGHEISRGAVIATTGFETLNVAASQTGGLMASVGGAGAQIAGLGDLASAAASGFYDLASAAAAAAKAASEIPGPPNAPSAPGSSGGGAGVPPGAQHGAIIAPRPGGTAVTVGEGGRAEVIAPVDALFSRIGDYVASRVGSQTATAGGGAQSSAPTAVTVHQEIQVTVSATDSPQDMARKIAAAMNIVVRDGIGPFNTTLDEKIEGRR